MGRKAYIGSFAALLCRLSEASAYGETLADANAIAYRSNDTMASNRYDLFATDEDFVQANSKPAIASQQTVGTEQIVEAARTAHAVLAEPCSTIGLE